MEYIHHVCRSDSCVYCVRMIEDALTILDIGMCVGVAANDRHTQKSSLELHILMKTFGLT